MNLDLIQLHPIMAGAIPSVMMFVWAVKGYILPNFQDDVQKRLIPLVVLLGVILFAGLMLPEATSWRDVGLNVLVAWISVMGAFSGGKALAGKS